MRLATVEFEGHAEAAVIHFDRSATPLGGTLRVLIERGPEALVAHAGTAAAPGTLAAGSYRLRAPLSRPTKNVFCVGRKYREHIAEGERARNVKIGVTEVPVFFTKPPTAVVGPAAEVPILPHVSTQVGDEVELAVVIGRPGRDIPRERAMEHVLGHTIVNDITARDVQRRHGGQYLKGRGIEGSCPMGPWIVTADEIADPGALGIRLWVNGELRQDGKTAAMIFDITTLIASLSEGLTLEPGDVIATGTPSGVGYAMDLPRFLAYGDKVVCEIDGIGRLKNAMRNLSPARRVA
jgi:2-keto-4-pentenoate hydratase/2-oxohepta-3-ene-1,7-dioic acid hydratase in catechol pathway